MDSAARHILVVTHTGRAAPLAAGVQVCHRLKTAGLTPVVPEDEHAALLHADPSINPLARLNRDIALTALEAVIVLGGDGTILRAAEITRSCPAPLVGVNLGHVGFLAEAERENLTETVQRVLERDYQVEERLALNIQVNHGNKLLATNWALNEAAIEKINRERSLEVILEIDQRPLTSFGCDGVLVATPTGSTAYAFSAGGPVIWPNAEALLVVPLSAHALFARPLVLGPTSTVAIELLERSGSTGVLWCDGRRATDLPPGARVTVQQSQTPVRLARLTPGPFTDRLVGKFGLAVDGWRGPASPEKESR